MPSSYNTEKIKTKAEHNSRLDKLLNSLNTAGFKVKKEKCNFLQTSIKYLGHKIDGEDLYTLSKHVNAIKAAPAPQNRSELKSFLELITYYSIFIKNAAQILMPLYSLLKDNINWSWFRDAREEFNNIKQILSSKPVIDYYNPNIPIKLRCLFFRYRRSVIANIRRRGGETSRLCFASFVLY